MAAAEAQACGTPVVAFRRGGLGEVIMDGVTGFLVPPGDIQAAAEAVAAGGRALARRPAASTPSASSTWSGAWTRTSGSTGEWPAGDRRWSG